MEDNRTIAYLRVSTAVQDVEKNKSDILHLDNEKGLGKVRWVEEQASYRPILAETGDSSSARKAATRR